MLVVVFIPSRFHALELAAICDVLAMANEVAVLPPRYDVRIVAEDHCATVTSSGRGVTVDSSIATCDGPIDLLIAAPGATGREAPSAALHDWIVRHGAAAARYGSIGNGAFLLGAAGLLDRRRVTTHWDCAYDLAKAFPAASVVADRIFVRDGPLFSAAGGVAAIDMMLALVEEDHGRDLSLDLARRLIMFMKRAGAQAQVSMQLATQTSTRDSIQRVQQHVRDNLTGDLSVTALAATAAMSPRNFARVFHQQTGWRPTDYVEQIRVNMAKMMVEESALSPQQVARACGFSGTEAARRAFRRRVGVTMTAYRAALDPGPDD